MYLSKAVLRGRAWQDLEIVPVGKDMLRQTMILTNYVSRFGLVSLILKRGGLRYGVSFSEEMLICLVRFQCFCNVLYCYICASSTRSCITHILPVLIYVVLVYLSRRMSEHTMEISNR